MGRRPLHPRHASASATWWPFSVIFKRSPSVAVAERSSCHLDFVADSSNRLMAGCCFHPTWDAEFSRFLRSAAPLSAESGSVDACELMQSCAAAVVMYDSICRCASCMRDGMHVLAWHAILPKCCIRYWSVSITKTQPIALLAVYVWPPGMCK